jgi:hypothetical protein
MEFPILNVDHHLVFAVESPLGRQIGLAGI